MKEENEYRIRNVNCSSLPCHYFYSDYRNYIVHTCARKVSSMKLATAPNERSAS